MASSTEEPKSKKLSKTEVDAKFKSRGVLPITIREAIGIEKLDVDKMRALLTVFEEAQDNNIDVANCSWAEAIDFYQGVLKVTLPATEVGPRILLVKDFLKRCWGVVCGRDPGQVEPTSVIGASASSDLVSTEGAAATTETEKVPLGSAAATQQPPDGEAEEDAAYSARLFSLAAARAKVIEELNSDIAKREKARETTLASLNRERLMRERAAHEREVEEQFVKEKKRRLDRVDELERESRQLSNKFGQGDGDKDRVKKSEQDPDSQREPRHGFGQGVFGTKKPYAEPDRAGRERDGFDRERREGKPHDAGREREAFWDRERREGKPNDAVSAFGDRHQPREDRVDESDRFSKLRQSREYRGDEYDRGSKLRDALSRNDDRRFSGSQEDDRRDRDFREEARDHEAARRDRLARGDRDLLSDRNSKGNSEPTPPRVVVEGESANQESMVKLVRTMATPEVMSIFRHSRLAESLKTRCALVGRFVNTVEEALSYERGAGILQTVAGGIAENLAMHFAPKLLDMLRTDPRSNWPLAQFTEINLKKTGSSELHSVQVQLAQGVAHPKSNPLKLVEQWETVNDLLEPLRRYAALVLAFDPLYGQAIYGLLGVVTRELMYAGSGAGLAVKPAEVHRLKIYIELIRFHYGGVNLNPATLHRFFHYDRVTGDEAQRSLSDVLRLEAKDAESSRDKKKKELAAAGNEKKLCYAWNGAEGGCKRGSGCDYLHSCSGCGKLSHGLAKCPKGKTT